MTAKAYALENLENFDNDPLGDSESHSPLDSVKSLEQTLNEKIELAPAEFKDDLTREYLSLGPLTHLISDPSVTEIILDSACIHFEKNGRLLKSETFFYSRLSYSRFIDRLFEETETKIDWNTPTADASWNGFRVHIISRPLCSQEHVITFRRHSKDRWNLSKLLQVEMFTEVEYSHLINLIDKQKNCLVVGPTGSGKTTLLNSFLAEVPETERVIILEDTEELKPPHDNSTKLLTRVDSESPLQDFNLARLLKESLRMRPDRIVLGEVRGEEAKDLLLTISTGHSGFLGTLHARSAREALWRLEMLVQMGAPSWAKETIRQLIAHSIDEIIVVERRSGTRRVKEIMKLSGLETSGFLLEPSLGFEI